MPHEIHSDGEHVVLVDVVEIDRRDRGARVRVLRGADGSAIVVAATGATRDGAPLIGNLGVVAAGAGAIVRAGTLRITIVWSATAMRRRATAASVDAAGRVRRVSRCRTCFGAFTPGEIVIACACNEEFHQDCERARIDCPGCGAPRMEVP